MKRSQIIFVALALVVVAVAAVFGMLYSSEASSADRAVVKETTTSAQPIPLPPDPSVLSGTIESLTKAGDQYLLRFDPILGTGGVTANVLQAEQKGESCEPTACPPVDNDWLTLDEGHQLLTYLVPNDAKVTALAGALDPVEISVAELADLVAGRSVGGIAPLPPYGTPGGPDFWIDVKGDTVSSITQQYRP